MGRSDTRRLPILFAALTLLPTLALAWLGAYVLAQDRELERQRRRDRLELVARRIAVDLERELQRIEAGLGDAAGVRIDARGLSSDAARPVLYQPVVPSSLPPFNPDFVRAQRLERRDAAAAVAEYGRLAARQDPALRGRALVALGGLLRTQGRYAEALAVYGELEALGGVHVVDGLPAALVGLRGRARTLESQGDAGGLRQAATDLAAMLGRGAWPIDRAAFDLFRAMVEEWNGGAIDPESIRRTDAAIELWQAWRSGTLPPRGRRLLGHEADAVLAFWAGNVEGISALFLTRADMQASWQPLWSAHGADVAVSHLDGRPLLGSRHQEAVILTPGDTGLPFVVTVSPGALAADGDRLRRTLFLGVLGLAVALVLAASLGLYRITTRELRLARQQSDFVAAVSHEFRTPLTSMRHLTDLLVNRPALSEPRKAQYYSLIAHETERLYRMVESLLSFGRMDAGAHVWRLEPVAVAPFLTGIVGEFREFAAGRVVDLTIEEGVPEISADREALSRALWNLLENAAKYSDRDRPIRVFARHRQGTVVIGVQDQGLGIPPADRQRIFQKFVRGDEAMRAGVRGVGIGLALVKRIAEAHGGRVDVESDVGCGSTFTLVIPCPGS